MQLKEFKTVAGFKRALKESEVIKTERYEGGQWTDLGIADIGSVQSNSFSRKVERGGKMVQSWCMYPSAKQCHIENNVITIVWEVRGKLQPILRYSFPLYFSSLKH